MKSKYKNRLVLDIGGNGVQYMINNDKIKSFSTVGKDKEFVIKTIVNLILENNINEVGISSPGACNSITGWIDGISGIKDYGNFNIFDEINSKLQKNVEITLMNDANSAMAYSLSQYEAKIAVQITIGTGIGGAYAIDGKIISGNKGYGGEFGYGLSFDGNKNISQNISSNALVSAFDGEYKNAKDIFLNATQDKRFIKWTDKLARFIINLQYFFDPEVIFIAGGVSMNDSFQKIISSKIKEVIKNDDSLANVPNIKVFNNKNSGILGINHLLDKKEQNV